MKMDVYDYIIIGGGITGLYAASKLSKNNKILIIDERDYWGGRIITHKNPHYEIGAARFNNTHKKLLQLIQNYGLTPIPLSKDVDYLDMDDGVMHKSVNHILDKYFELIIQESAAFPKDYLQKCTLYEFICDLLDKEQADLIVNMFGYYSELKIMNAYQALEVFKTDFVSQKYYVLKEGLSALCLCITKEIKRNRGLMISNTKVTHVSRVKVGKSISMNKDTIFSIETETQSSSINKTYYSKKILFCLKASHIREFSILKNIHPFMKYIHGAPLLRIYAKYPTNQGSVWFNDLGRTTTNGILRQIIPIDYSKGLIMISYTDGKDINVFRDKYGKLKKESEIKMQIQYELQDMFETIKIPEPTFFKTHYWELGAHHWKPKCDPSDIQKKISNPSDGIFVCGEAFSMKQAWIEGGLESFDELSLA